MTDPKIVEQQKEASLRKKAFQDKFTMAQRYQAWCDMHPWHRECKIYEV